MAIVALTAPASADRLYTVSPGDANLRTVDPFTGATLSSVPITGPLTFAGANGLAVHPQTGVLWTILQVRGTSGRFLATLNPSTGVATVIGNTNRSFAGLAFSGTGVLFGVSGDGDAQPETLFTIDQNTAVATMFLALGNGNDGETIAFDPGSGKLLHASGYGLPNQDEVLETIDLGTATVTVVPLSGFDYNEALGLTHWVGRNFLMSDLNDDLIVINPNGVASKLASLDHSAKGLAFLPTPSGPYFAVYGDACPSLAGHHAITGGSGTPGLGQQVTVRVANGFGGAPAALAIGFGQAAFPITPNCSVQILPLSAVVVPLMLGGSGGGNGTAALPLQLPAAVPPMDLYFQTAFVENLNLLVSSPVHMHAQ